MRHLYPAKSGSGRLGRTLVHAGLSPPRLGPFHGARQSRRLGRFAHGFFSAAVASAPQLEHFDFSCSTDPIIANVVVSVQDIFPVASWPNLRHFGIHQLNVLPSDLLSLLAALPVSVRSVKLSYLDLDKSGSYHTLLCDMRDELGWRDRAPDQRPRVRIILHLETVKWYESFVTNVDTKDDQALSDTTENPADHLFIDEPANKYLYSNMETDVGPNPFIEDWPHLPMKGIGIVARSWAHPSFETQY